MAAKEELPEEAMLDMNELFEVAFPPDTDEAEGESEGVAASAVSGSMAGTPLATAARQSANFDLELELEAQMATDLGGAGAAARAAGEQTRPAVAGTSSVSPSLASCASACGVRLAVLLPPTQTSAIHHRSGRLRSAGCGRRAVL